MKMALFSYDMRDLALTDTAEDPLPVTLVDLKSNIILIPPTDSIACSVFFSYLIVMVLDGRSKMPMSAKIIKD